MQKVAISVLDESYVQSEFEVLRLEL